MGEIVIYLGNPGYYLERACQSQILAISTGRPLKLVPSDVADRTAGEYANDAEVADLNFSALKRPLDRSQPDFAA